MIDLRLLVRVVELESTKLVLNALNDDLRDLIQLVLPGILVTLLLHQLVDFVVFHAPGELALRQILAGRALIVPLQALKDIVTNLLSDVRMLALFDFRHHIDRIIAVFTFVSSVLPSCVL